MIPIRDDNPTRTFPFVTIALIVLNAAVFLYELSLPERRGAAFLAQFGLIPSQFSHAPTPPEFLSVVTSMFLHGGWGHILGNMLYLWIFGNNIEDAVGHYKFVIFYLLCGVAAAAAQIVIDPDSTTPMVGASGAISGVLGAYTLLYPRARVTLLVPIFIFIRFFEVPAVMMLLFWFGMQLLSGLTQVGTKVPGGVAFWAHIGGFVAGLILIPTFKKQGVRLFQ